MRKFLVQKFIGLPALVFFLSFTAVTRSETVFYDDFNTPHNYLTEGAGGTGWDNYIGPWGDATVPSTANKIDSNTTNCPNAPGNRGCLYMESVNGNWDSFGAEDLRGPYLYKLISGDFTATVKITGYPGCTDGGNLIWYDEAGIMARVANLEESGLGEDTVEICYSPIWYGINCGDINDGNEEEDDCIEEPTGCGAYKYIQLERKAEPNGLSIFFFRASPDGQTWYPRGWGNRVRSDMAGTIQIGLRQAGYTPNKTWICFDDFKITRRGSGQAWFPKPSDGAQDVDPFTEISWDAGDAQTQQGHSLYFSTDKSKVESGDASVRSINDTNSFNPPAPLKSQTRYYSRVDEVNGVNITVGDVWQFSVMEYTTVTGDFNGDSIVNYDDLKIMHEEWLTAGNNTDIKEDGIVNFSDFAVFANNWMFGITCK
jgi:hypothetical protein